MFNTPMEKAIMESKCLKNEAAEILINIET